jgi:hypothetical protein
MNTLKLLGLVGVFALGTSGCQSSASGQTPLLTKYGVGTVVHPVKAPPAVGGPYQCLSNVHVFGVNGCDPLCVANFNGLCAYLKQQGCNTHFAQLHSITDMAGQIRKIRATDPNAKVVLMGFSLGCNRICALAHQLKKEDIQIDLLVYLGADTMLSGSKSCPSNVSHVLNVRAHGYILTGGNLLNGADYPGAHNVKLDTRHLRLPSRPEVTNLVMEELLALTGGTTSPAVPASEAPASRAARMSPPPAR